MSEETQEYTGVASDDKEYAITAKVNLNFNDFKVLLEEAKNAEPAAAEPTPAKASKTSQVTADAGTTPAV